MTPSLVTLAAQSDWGQIIAGAVGVLFVVGGYIFNQFKEMQKAREAQQRKFEQQFNPGAAIQTSREKLDELAARRRQELQNAVRQRMTGKPATAESTSLTMTQRIERERARALAARRAQELQSKAGLTSGRFEAELPRQRAPVAAPGMTQKQVQQLDLARRRAQQIAQAQRRLHAQKIASRPQSSSVTTPPPPRSQPPAEKPKPIIAERPIAKPTMIESLASAPTAAATKTPAPPQRNLSLRDAWIWKEILDRPLALRETNR